MSMLSPSGGKDVGERVAAFADYAAAQKAVSALIAADIPAREIAIVGTGLRSIERVTGKLGYAAAARSGAMNGVLLGMFFAAIMMFGAGDAPIQMFLGVILVGIAVGMLMSLITYAVVRRRRDYASVMQVTADHYDVFVQPTSIHRARGVLGTAPTGQSRRQPAQSNITPGAPTQPPRYGELADDTKQAPPAQPAPAPRPGAAQTPDGRPRYGEMAGPDTPSVQPQAEPVKRPEAPTADEPPRYGERVVPAQESRPGEDDHRPAEAQHPHRDR